MVANEPEFVSLQHIIVMHFLMRTVLSLTPWSSSIGGKIGNTKMQKYMRFRGVAPLFAEHWTQPTAKALDPDGLSGGRFPAV